jgi:Phosphoinositide phospholipase C, Ca2+-dependent
MNEIQVIATHNSYKRELPKVEQAAHDALYGGAPIYDGFLAYSHASLPNQLGRQGARGLELDLYPDPERGLFAYPLLRRRLGAGRLMDLEWSRPGIKVLHTADLDYNSSCVRPVSCLRLVARWSRADGGHLPLLVLLELKGTDPLARASGGVRVPWWDGAALGGLDREVRPVLGRSELITPEDVRRRGLTLEQSVLRKGWPTLLQASGRVAFLMDNEPGAISRAYTAGRPNLERRVLFIDGRSGRPDAAFVKRNDPTGPERKRKRIARLVRRGYLVRTRSDEPLATVRAGDKARARRAGQRGAARVDLLPGGRHERPLRRRLRRGAARRGLGPPQPGDQAGRLPPRRTRAHVGRTPLHRRAGRRPRALIRTRRFASAPRAAPSAAPWRGCSAWPATGAAVEAWAARRAASARARARR